MSEKPDQLAVMERFRRYLQEQIRTLAPAKIVEYDRASATATVQILRKGRDAGGRSFLGEPLPSVPCSFFRAGGALIIADYNPGDEVMIGICDRSIAEWYETGEPRPTADPRRHSLTDAIVLFGTASSKGNPLPSIPAANLYIGREDLQGFVRITLGDTVEVEIEGSAIRLGGSSTEGVILESFRALFNAHTHGAGALLDNGGGACSGSTGTPAIPAPASVVSSKVSAE